jgi:hypothetical protein
MKKKFLGGVIIFIFLLYLTPTSQAITIGFSPSEQRPEVGVSTSVDLVISGLGDFAPDSLGQFELDISYDPSILQFTTYELGPFLGDLNLGEAIDGSLVEIAPGSINLFELSLLEADLSTCIFCIPPFLDDIQPGSFSLASLNFETLAVGRSPLDISIITLSNGFGDPLTAAVQPGSISPVPEPTTILLLASGMAGLGIFGRKKFKKSN